MQKRLLGKVMLLSFVSTFLFGCASTPKSPHESSSTVFQQPIEQVQMLAVDALIVTGFDISKQEPTYVEGFRPRKIGLLVGSGGETVGVWLFSKDADKTEVRVDTARSFVGIVGQKNWNAEILKEMSKSRDQKF